MEWWEAALRLLLALVLSSIVGIERERKNKPAGIRTHILVCVGATIIAIVEQLIIADSLARMAVTGNASITFNIGRLTAQVISGIGFMGAGTIFITKKKVEGLTTAASLWNMACLGIAIGMGYYVIAILSCIIVVVVLSLLHRVIRVNTIKYMEVKYTHRQKTLAFINSYFEANNIQITDIDFNVDNETEGKVFTNIYTMNLHGKINYVDIINTLSEDSNILSIRTRNI